MGDMKTPDFDDLLAAFDIPDMDAREAIHSGPEDGEGGAKPAAAVGGEPAPPDHGLPPAVSVIVKNTVCPEQADLTDGKDGPRLLHNGFTGPEGPPAAANGGESWGPRAKAKPADLFTDFTPVENPIDGRASDLIDGPRDAKPIFEGPALCPPPPGDPPAEGGHGLARAAPQAFGKLVGDGGPGAHAIKEEPAEESPPGRLQHAPPWAEPEPETPKDAPPKTVPEAAEEPGANPAAGVKEEPSWSPRSLASDEEEGGMSSPSLGSSRPLKVRIKTVKTQSGSITRTVTAVSSDSEGPPEPGQEGAAEAKAEGEVPPKGRQPSPPNAPASAAEAAKVPLGNGVKFPGPALPASTIQSASSVMLMAASVAQQKAAVVPPPKTGKVVAKNIFHLVQQPLANVNPAAAAASPQRNATVVMVQSQKAATAAPGTVISRTQSSLVESFNKILNSKNLLPTYRPNLAPPADASLSLPASGFRCLECGDAFALERSLARHYDRRSMRIEVTCNHCTKRLVFFNKCSLLLHARRHKDNGLVMQCSHLVMRPIALEQMIGQPDVTPLVSLAVLTPGKEAAAPPSVAAASPAPADPALLPQDGSTYSTFRCLECKEQCKNKAGLAQHFQQVAANTNIASMVCPLCPMMMANRCSLEAHQRMHKQTPPSVCPECGGNFRPDTFQSHLKETCLHYSRRIGYRCQSCALVFGGVNSIKSHIQTAHCEVFHKCPICPMAFKSAPSAHAHIFTQHPGFSNQQAKMIYKCAMCDTVFTHKPLLCSHLDHAHFDQQLGNQRVSVFKCPECPLLFAQKRTMLEHLKTTHNSVVKEDPPPSPEPVTPKPEPVEIPLSRPPEPDPPAAQREESSSSDCPSSPDIPKKKKTKEPRKADPPRHRGNCWTCGICHSWFPERDEYVLHMKREHGKSVKKFPCRLCDRSFCSAPSLRRHVRVNHEGIKRVYPCRYCTEGKRTFSSRLILEKHIQVRHGIKTTDPTRSQEVMVTRNIRSQAAMRKRKLSSDDSGSDEPEKVRPAPPPVAKPKRGFQCRACGYKTASLSDFRQHIPQHCTDESSHQCRECGMCFTSQSSLSRHRFMTHKVKGAPREAEPASKAEEPDGDGGKLSCQVCNRTFDSQLNLNTHFRTHGMAFIKQRQSGAAADN